MPQEEITHRRDIEYSVWHRRKSLERWLPGEVARKLTMIDLDYFYWLECDDRTKRVIAVIETAYDRGQGWKAATAISLLAKQANVWSFVVLYKPDDEQMNPADPRVRDIKYFRVMRLNPDERHVWYRNTPEEFAKNLVKMRELWKQKRLWSQPQLESGE